MKKCILFISIGIVSTIQTWAAANIFASSLRGESQADGYHITYVLNETATAAEFQALNENGGLIKSFALTALAKGENTAVINPAEIPAGNYRWRIKATAEAVTAPTRLTDNSLKYQFWNTYGVAVDNNPESAYFGRVYMTSSLKGTLSSGRTTTQGIYIFDATLEPIIKENEEAYGGGISWASSNSPFRLSVAPDGRVFINDYSDSNSGIYIMNPEDPEADFTALFAGLTRNTAGLASNSDGTIVHGSSASCYVLGEGSETKLYTIDEDYPGKPGTGGATAKQNILQYNIGTANSWTEAPSDTVFDNLANNGWLINSNNVIVPDGRGGWWISQYRGTETAQEPGLIHFNGESVDFSTGNNLSLLDGNSRQGGLAVSVDGTMIAMASANAINILGVTWNDANSPSLERLYQIKPALGNNTNGLAFDWGGNVYLVSNSGERLGVWALPKGDENTAVTPAPSQYTIEGTKTTTDISELSKEERFKFYPNPVQDMLNIEAAYEPINTLQVYSITGSLVYDLRGAENNQQSIDMSVLPQGSYLLKVNGETFKIMKR